MYSCPGPNSGPSCRQVLQNSTAPFKRNEILEKSEVIQIPSLTPRQKPFFVFSCFELKPSSEPCIRIYFLYIFSIYLLYWIFVIDVNNRKISGACRSFLAMFRFSRYISVHLI